MRGFRQRSCPHAAGARGGRRLPDSAAGVRAGHVRAATLRLLDDRELPQNSVNDILQTATASSGAISRNGRSVEITVQDDGIGFGPDALERARSTSHGAGLVGIRERARILGGRVDIRSGARAEQP